MKILLIGSLPPPLGGTALTFELLKNELNTNKNIDITVINTVGIRNSGHSVPIRLLNMLIQFIKGIRKADVVSLHIATTALPTAGLAVAGLCKLFKKPFVLRKFASTDYKVGGIKGVLSQFAISMSDLFLVETRALVELSQRRGICQTRWFPTHRNPPQSPGGNRSVCAKHFVFIGHVREYKGIHELLDAGRILQRDDIQIDIFGPLFPPFTKETIESENVRYRGVLYPQDVVATLAQYDALILPTKAPTEGYPGVIVEALSAGIPVISTECGAIPELVGNDCGILVPPGQSEAIASAISTLRNDSQHYTTLKRNVVNRSMGLSTGYWARVFTTYCELSMQK